MTRATLSKGNYLCFSYIEKNALSVIEGDFGNIDNEATFDTKEAIDKFIRKHNGFEKFRMEFITPDDVLKFIAVLQDHHKFLVDHETTKV